MLVKGDLREVNGRFLGSLKVISMCFMVSEWIGSLLLKEKVGNIHIKLCFKVKIEYGSPVWSIIVK